MKQTFQFIWCLIWKPGDWVIPENIHTILRVASWNSKGEGGGGFLGLEFRRHGGNADWNSKGMGVRFQL